MAINYGVQLYSLRDIIKDKVSLEKTLEQIKKLGVDIVELTNAYGATPKELMQISHNTGVKIHSTHTDFQRLTKETEKVIEEHLEFGCNNIGIGCMPRNLYDISKIEELKKFGNCLNNIGSIAEKYNTTVTYHNHAFEFNKIAQKSVLDYIIEYTNNNIMLTLDLYWVTVGGEDAFDAIEKYKNRINILHLKDYKKGIFRPKMLAVGKGQLNIIGLLKKAETCGIEYAMIELDRSKQPMDDIIYGIHYLQKYYI